MKRMRMKVKFTKMHGLGNDFVLMDDRKAEVSARRNCAELAQKLCDRHLGVGADGLILVRTSVNADMAFCIYNADGSLAGMCGNGIRCFAKFLYEKICSKKELLIETQAGPIRCFCEVDSKDRVTSVRVDMGKPRLSPKEIPVLVDGRGPSFPIEISGRKFSFTPVSMGNPHAVIFVEDVEGFPVELFGPSIENHALFPERTNVEFVEVLSEKKLKMRVWERGCGITMACGTGACASLVAASLVAKSDRKAEVMLPGGSLFIFWDEASDHVVMQGPAEEVFEGSMEI